MIVKSLVVGCCLLHILQRVSATNATQTRLYQVVIPSWSFSGVSRKNTCNSFRNSSCRSMLSNFLNSKYLIWNHISFALKNFLSVLSIRNKISVLACSLCVLGINHILQELVEVRLLFNRIIILRSVRICRIISCCFFFSSSLGVSYNFIIFCIIVRILIL